MSLEGDKILDSTGGAPPDSFAAADGCALEGGRKRRRHSSSRADSERLEKMARDAIERAMTAVVVRKCWSCRRRFVKDEGCHVVQCVCEALTCYRCGERVEFQHVCLSLLPRASSWHVRRAAENVKQNLRMIHPGLKFKYDPSRKLTRRSRRRKRNKRNNE